jgi:hypothetical protein
MKARFSLRLLLLLLLLRLAAPLAAHAQAPTKVFVASYGSDANDGSRGSPKRNFQAAHNAVAGGGQIVVLDTAGYGALTINKSLAITVPPGVNGFVTVSGTNNGITINAGATDSVSLRGLIVEGGGGGDGIRANSVGNLAIEDCTVRNFNDGISVASTTAAKTYLRRCTMRGCGDGLFIQPGTPVKVSAIATDCQFEQNSNAGAAAASISGDRSADLTLVGCVLSGNASGVLVIGVTVLARVDNCRITGNDKGVVINAHFGGTLLSRGNNTLENNTSGNDTGSLSGNYSAK